MRKKLKNGLWGVINPPATIKWFRKEEDADEYIEMLEWSKKEIVTKAAEAEKWEDGSDWPN